MLLREKLYVSAIWNLGIIIGSHVPRVFFNVWLELKGPSWNSDSLIGRLSRLSEASPPLTLPMKSPSNHSHPA